MKENKKQYSTPVITVVAFRAERGYALSGLGLSSSFELDPENARTQEQWNTTNYADDSHAWF